MRMTADRAGRRACLAGWRGDRPACGRVCAARPMRLRHGPGSAADCCSALVIGALVRRSARPMSGRGGRRRRADARSPQRTSPIGRGNASSTAPRCTGSSRSSNQAPQTQFKIASGSVAHEPARGKAAPCRAALPDETTSTDRPRARSMERFPWRAARSRLARRRSSSCCIGSQLGKLDHAGGAIRTARASRLRTSRRGHGDGVEPCMRRAHKTQYLAKPITVHGASRLATGKRSSRSRKIQGMRFCTRPRARCLPGSRSGAQRQPRSRCLVEHPAFRLSRSRGLRLPDRCATDAMHLGEILKQIQLDVKSIGTVTASARRRRPLHRRMRRARARARRWRGAASA